MRYFIYHWRASDNNMKHTHQLEDELTDNINEGIYRVIESGKNPIRLANIEGC